MHHEPYYVEYIDDADGQRVYTHDDDGHAGARPRRRAHRDRRAQGRARPSGTAERHPLADGRPAAGKTGTQQDNTNSWFVGFTPHLTTSVWIGDPDGYTPMNGIEEFAEYGSETVQGGRSRR